MSWKLGKKSKPQSAQVAVSSNDTDPTLNKADGMPHFRSGVLTIGVRSAEGLSLPAGVSIPPAVQGALKSSEANVASCVSPSSVTQQRLARRANRESMQRVQCWWLPYIVMEFEVNQVLITPIGGQLSSPVYMYQTPL